MIILLKIPKIDQNLMRVELYINAKFNLNVKLNVIWTWHAQ